MCPKLFMHADGRPRIFGVVLDTWYQCTTWRSSTCATQLSDTCRPCLTRDNKGENSTPTRDNKGENRTPTHIVSTLHCTFRCFSGFAYWRANRPGLTQAALEPKKREQHTDTGTTKARTAHQQETTKARTAHPHHTKHFFPSTYRALRRMSVNLLLFGSVCWQPTRLWDDVLSTSSKW